MYPIFFKINGITVYSWGVVVAIAFVIAYKVAEFEFRRKGLEKELLESLFIASVIGGLGGSKILFLMQNVSFAELLNDPTRYLHSGFTFLGGFFGALFLVIIITRWKKVRFWLVADTLIPAVAIGYSIGRIACLLAGDDYGVPSGLPWAMAFPDGADPTTIKVHPTQIYESVIMAFVFILLWKLRKKPNPTGWLSSVGFILLGAERFLLEFIRVTTPSFIPGLSIAQLMSLGIIIVGSIKIISIRNRRYQS